MSKYSDIIERLEKATGPDRVLDAAILLAIEGWTMHEDTDPKIGVFAFWEGEPWKSTCHNCSSWEAVTASIDAAIALVERMLPGCEVAMTDIHPDFVNENQNRHAVDIANGLRWETSDVCHEPIYDLQVSGSASTRPIAILIALFRALEAKESAA